MAPLDEGEWIVIGSPNDGDSEIRTVRGITFLQTASPKWVRTSATT
jgi:hypothetical protein